jgi:RNA polymerase sigma factor (sigma-70 family)
MLSVCSDPSNPVKSVAGNIRPAGPRGPATLEAQARFLEVVPPHLGAARALARSLTSSGADSEDVVQDACLRAFRGIASFRGVNARCWLLTIVRRAAYDWLSQSRRTPETVADFECLTDQLEVPQDAVTPESELALDQDRRKTDQAIQSLPLMLRNAILLRYEQGLSYREIALAIDVPIGTVMSRLCRAHRRLGTMLEEIAGDRFALP